MKTKKNEQFWENFVFLCVLFTLLGSLIWVAVTMAGAPYETAEAHARVKSDYVLMLLQCAVGILAMGFPTLLRRRWGLVIPSRMMILYAVFLYASIYLGEVRNFYYRIPHWDNILHGFSGLMLGALAFSVIQLLNKSDRVPVTLSPLFVAVFTFCFAVTVGVAWEVYEFAADGLLGTNMQKFGPWDGAAFSGRAALHDTMADLILDALGGLIMALVGYVSLKFQKGWVEKLQLRVQGS
ncbi:MAG: hypothetical protein IJA68_02535 [Clostridia bacterium]|nr:hypothetical protein [Clostridia bacterium]